MGFPRYRPFPIIPQIEQAELPLVATCIKALPGSTSATVRELRRRTMKCGAGRIASPGIVLEKMSSAFDQEDFKETGKL